MAFALCKGSRNKTLMKNISNNVAPKVGKSELDISRGLELGYNSKILNISG